MKITYSQNPLATIVELNEQEKKELWYKLKIENLSDDLFSAHFSLQEGKYFDLKRAREAVDPSWYCSDDKPMKVDAHVDMMLKHYVEELSGEHAGDCTCVACTCSKCLAEDMIGIQTTSGLNKYMGSTISSVFRNNKSFTCEDAIRFMENESPKITEDWHQAHIDRWTKDHNQALEWLKNYNETFLKGK